MSPNISKDPLARLAERQTWISDAKQERLQASVAAAVTNAGGDRLRQALHGDWLHEPLHAVLTDVPVGSWSATVVFDAIAVLTGSAALDKAADATLVLGLAAATGAAVTGLNDWSEIKSPAARRIGMVHAALNIAATAIFLGSALARYKRARNFGRALSSVGFVLVSASAHLGGNLVYEHGIGVAELPGSSNVTRDMKR